MPRKLLDRTIATTVALSLIWVAPGCNFYSALAQQATEGNLLPADKPQPAKVADVVLFQALQDHETTRLTEQTGTHPFAPDPHKVRTIQSEIFHKIWPVPLKKPLEERKVFQPAGEVPGPEQDASKHSPDADVQLEQTAERAVEPASRSKSLEESYQSQAAPFVGASAEQAANLASIGTPGSFSKRRIEELRKKFNGKAKIGSSNGDDNPPAPPQKPPSNQNPDGKGFPKWPAWLAAAGLVGWVLFSGPIRYNPVISTLSWLGYVWVGNPIGFFFAFPQVGTTVKAGNADSVHLWTTLLPLIGAILLTLTAYYMTAPFQLLAAQNLFEVFTFGALLGLKAYYVYKRKKGSLNRTEPWFQKLSSRTLERYNAFAEKLKKKILPTKKESSRDAARQEYEHTDNVKLIYRRILINFFKLWQVITLRYFILDPEENTHQIQSKTNAALEKLISILEYRLTPEAAAVWLKTIPIMILISTLTVVFTFIVLPHAAPLLQPWVRAHKILLISIAAGLFGGFSLVGAVEIEKKKSSAGQNSWVYWLFGFSYIGLSIFSLQETLIRRVNGTDWKIPAIYLISTIAGMATAVLKLITINKYDPQGADPRYKEKFFRILKYITVPTALAAFCFFHSSWALHEISCFLFGNDFLLKAPGFLQSLWLTAAAGGLTWLVGALSWKMGSFLEPLPRKIVSWLDILIPWLNKKFPRLGLGERELDFEQRLEFYKKNFGIHEIIRVDHGGDPVQRALKILSLRLLRHNPHIQVVPWDIKGQAREIDLVEEGIPTDKILDEVRDGEWLVGLGGGANLDLDALAEAGDRSEGRDPQQLGPHHFGEAAFSEIYLIPVRDPDQNKKIRERNSTLKLSKRFETGLPAPFYA